MSKIEVMKLTEVVFQRAPGNPHQELGGTMVTLARLAWLHGYDMDDMAERELRRIETPEIVRKCRRRQRKKFEEGVAVAPQEDMIIQGVV